jgi:hypothetical protein
MVCRNCGAQLTDGAQFCVKCGMRVTGPSAAQPQGVAYAPAVPVIYRKRHQALKALIVILSIALLAGGAYLIWGVQLGLAQKDLGVKWTQRDFNSVTAKLGVVTEAPPKGTDRSKFTKEFSGTQNIDWTLTSSEVTAWMNKDRPGYWPFADVQIKFHDNNRIEASAKVNLGKLMTYSLVKSNLPQEAVGFIASIPLQIPVYLDIKGGFTGTKSVAISLNELKIPFMSITGDSYGGEPNNVLNRIVDGILAEAEQVNISGFSTSEGAMHMTGTWFTAMERVPVN